MWYLYILFSEKLNKYYIGISQNPDRRLEYHNSIEKGWTRTGIPWVLKYKHSFQDRTIAQYWEKKVKAQKRRDIIKLIISGNFEFKKVT